MNESTTELQSLLSRQRDAWARHAPINVETLLDENPDLRGKKESVLGLINHEIVLRSEFGTPATRAEYVERFPDLENELKELFEAQLALAAADAPSSRRETINEPWVDESVFDWPAVPNYTVIAMLGQGGMGVVYKATDHRLKRTVALKMIRGGHAGSEERRRFQLEAEAVAHLDHPGIVHIYEVGESNGQPFFALEYVDGGSLSGALRGLPQPFIAAAHLAETLARAIHYAHGHGIIHRDLKPANILLQKVGETQTPTGVANCWVHAGVAYLPKITDFGLAKQIQNETDASQSQAIVGTPSYMAPEQAGDFMRRIGPTADVYSLGAILYEMLVGRPPFRGENVLDTLDQVRTQDPIAVTRLQPKVPADLETICMKCLRKDPGERYASAEAFADDLGRFLRHEPILARPTSAWQHLRLWCRRRPVVAGLSGALITGALVAFVLVTYLWLRALKGEADTRAQLYHSRIDIAHRNWHENNLGRFRTLLESLRPPAFGSASNDLRDFEWYYLWGLLHPEIAKVPADACLAFQPDGALIAAGAQNDIHLWRTADLEAGTTPAPVAKLHGHGTAVIALAFSPKGDRLLSAAKDRTARLWDVAKRRTIRTLPVHPAEITSVAFSSADGLMAVACTDGSIHLWEPDGSLRLVLDEHNGVVSDIAFSADGRRLISGGSDRNVIVWDVATGAAVRKVQAHVGGVNGVAFNGDRIASTGLDASFRLWDARDGKLLHTNPQLPRPVPRLAFRGDGKRLAAACLDNTVRTWDTPLAFKPNSIEPALIFRADFGQVAALAFSPKGERLASVSRDGFLRVWDARNAPDSRAFDLPTLGNGLALHPRLPLAAVAGKDKKIHLWNWQTDRHSMLAGHTGEVRTVAFTKDGSLASAGLDGKILVWDIDQEKLLRELPGPRPPTFALDFHPGGHRIVSAGAEGAVVFWEAAGGRKLYEGPSHQGAVNHLAFSPDGRVLASAGNDGVVIICDAETGREIRRFSDAGCKPMALAFSADGEMLAAADVESTIRIWNVRTGRRLHQLEGHEAPVQGLAFSRTGKRLASASADHTIKVWDVRTGQDLLTLRGHGRGAEAVFFAQDDTVLISLGRTAAGPSQIRVWDSTRGRH